MTGTDRWKGKKTGYNRPVFFLFIGRDRLGSYHLYKDGCDYPADLYVGASAHVRFTFGEYDGVFRHGGDIVASIR